MRNIFININITSQLSSSSFHFFHSLNPISTLLFTCYLNSWSLSKRRRRKKIEKEREAKRANTFTIAIIIIIFQHPCYLSNLQHLQHLHAHSLVFDIFTGLSFIKLHLGSFLFLFLSPFLLIFTSSFSSSNISLSIQ